MKRRFAKIWAFIMVFVVTSSSSGMTINRHLCGGHEKSKSFIFQAEKCVNEVKSQCQKPGHSDQFKRTPCCSDHSVFLKQLINIDLENAGQEVVKNQLWATLPISLQELYLPVKNTFVPAPYYRPPPLIRDVWVIFQNFRL